MDIQFPPHCGFGLGQTAAAQQRNRDFLRERYAYRHFWHVNQGEANVPAVVKDGVD
jgi:hypothetical protein